MRVTRGPVVSMTRAFDRASDAADGIARSASLPAASRSDDARARPSAVESRSRLFWPAATVYVPLALLALLIAVNATVPPLSSARVSGPPTRVTGSEKWTVTFRPAPGPYVPFGVKEVTPVTVGA